MEQLCHVNSFRGERPSYFADQFTDVSRKIAMFDALKTSFRCAETFLQKDSKFYKAKREKFSALSGDASRWRRDARWVPTPAQPVLRIARDDKRECGQLARGVVIIDIETRH